MQHRIAGKKLSRNSAHRAALLKNLSLSLLKYGTIKTTLPKAKALRPFVERVITLSKESTLSNRRLFISKLGGSVEANKIFDNLNKAVASRNGGYTRIVKLGFRHGDNAPMAVMQLIDATSGANQ